MPNVEFMAPWFRSEALIRSMSFETWQTLSPRAQRMSRYIVHDRAEAVIGEGVQHPRRAERERVRDAQLAAMDPVDAEIYERRS